VPLEASRKVVVAAGLALPEGGRVRLVNVHLDVSAGLARILVSGNAWRLDQSAASNEARQLADGASNPAGAEPPSIATLVAGDFNVWSRGNSALKLFRREFPESPPALEQSTRGLFSPDHLFFAESADRRVQLVRGSFRRIEDRYYSDHHGLSVLLATGR
jgi:endonuclease/exonuclease/phosphatase family metal-dependent hydrolase